MKPDDAPLVVAFVEGIGMVMVVVAATRVLVRVVVDMVVIVVVGDCAEVRVRRVRRAAVVVKYILRVDLLWLPMRRNDALV